MEYKNEDRAQIHKLESIIEIFKTKWFSKLMIFSGIGLGIIFLFSV